MAVFPFTVRATDSEGSYADRQFNITVRNSRVERFMAVDATDAWTSPDATTWTQRNGAGGIACAYGNGFWLIIRSINNSSVFKSTDGINYTSIANTDQIFLDETGTTTTGFALNSIGNNTKLKFWNGRFWIATINGNASAATGSLDLWSTVDGITWKRKRLLTLSTATTLALAGGTYNFNFSEDNGTLFIPQYVRNTSAVPTSGWGFGWSTTDGENFTQIKSSAQTTGSTSASFLTRINGVYFAQVTELNGSTGVVNPTVYQYSTDGLNWTTQSWGGPRLGTSAYPQGFIYVNGQVYVFASRNASAVQPGIMAVSSDGLTWTEQPYKTFWSATSFSAGNTNYLFKNGVFLLASTGATGADATADNSLPNNGMRVSVDGVNWTPVNTIGTGVKGYYDIAAM